MLRELQCSIFRGGTSKGAFVMEEDLPENKEERDQILLKIMGSPDQRQINGLGGAVSTTSKVASFRKKQQKIGMSIIHLPKFRSINRLSPMQETAGIFHQLSGFLLLRMA